MLKLRNKLNGLLQIAATSNVNLTSEANVHVTAPSQIKNIAIDEKEKLSKPRSQIKGVELLRNPSLFKGMAFTIEERQLLGIQGLIPPAVLSQEVQALRIMTNFKREQSDLDRYIDLINLQDRFEFPLFLLHSLKKFYFNIDFNHRIYIKYVYLYIHFFRLIQSYFKSEDFYTKN